MKIKTILILLMGLMSVICFLQGNNLEGLGWIIVTNLNVIISKLDKLHVEPETDSSVHKRARDLSALFQQQLADDERS